MAKTNNPTATTVPQIQPERVNFHKLIAANPNYFGNIANSPFPPVVQIQNNTSFEEVTCIGFNPVTNILEAVIQIKRPNGYGGDPCAAGSFEYVRFFLNYGLGWEDAGLAGAVIVILKLTALGEQRLRKSDTGSNKPHA